MPTEPRFVDRPDRRLDQEVAAAGDRLVEQAEVAVPHVVGENDHEVGLFFLSARKSQKKGAIRKFRITTEIFINFPSIMLSMQVGSE